MRWLLAVYFISGSTFLLHWSTFLAPSVTAWNLCSPKWKPLLVGGGVALCTKGPLAGVLPALDLRPLASSISVSAKEVGLGPGWDSQLSPKKWWEKNVVPSKFLCPSDPSLAKTLKRTEQSVGLGREMRGVRGALTEEWRDVRRPSVTATELNKSPKRVSLVTGAFQSSKSVVWSQQLPSYGKWSLK